MDTQFINVPARPFSMIAYCKQSKLDGGKNWEHSAPFAVSHVDKVEGVIVISTVDNGLEFTFNSSI